MRGLENAYKNQVDKTIYIHSFEIEKNLPQTLDSIARHTILKRYLQRQI